MRLLVVCGLKAEAAIAAGPGVEVLVGGGRSDALAGRLAEALADRRPEGVLSFGLAGALAPTLGVGDLLVGGAVTYRGETLEADPPWREALRRCLHAPETAFAADDEVAASAEAKARLRAATGADVVDMESGVVALACRRSGLPFAILRAVSDDATSSIPPAAVAGMGAEGQIRIGAVLASLARRPQDLPGLIGMGRGSATALRTLRRAHAKLGPALAFPV